eukprot:2999435-Karenia_brevis.AAC.1
MAELKLIRSKDKHTLRTSSNNDARRSHCAPVSQAEEVELKLIIGGRPMRLTNLARACLSRKPPRPPVAPTDTGR